MLSGETAACKYRFTVRHPCGIEFSDAFVTILRDLGYTVADTRTAISTRRTLRSSLRPRAPSIWTNSSPSVPISYDGMNPMLPLESLFGQIDIYFFDQLLRGRIIPGMCIFDAGCGNGRNLVYLLREGYDVFGVDADPQAVAATRALAASLAPGLPPDNFRAEPVEDTSFPDGFADVVISSAVLHFARDDAHFDSMLHGTWRVLKPGGLFFCRLASSIGIEGQVHQVAGRRFVLPDSSERYLVTEERLLVLANQLGGQFLDPLKTTVVQNQRAMTTWVMRRIG